MGMPYISEHMKTFALPLVIAAALAGCAQSNQVMGPSGKVNHSIRCGAMLIDQCYEEAARVCPASYDMIDRPTRHVGPNLMLVECKGSIVEAQAF